MRGSPSKYCPAFLRDFATGMRQTPGCTVRLVLILDRREPESAREVVEAALKARETYGDFVVGLDVAGDEHQGPPEELAPHFTPAFERCVPITIHAGETRDAESIWSAVYHLHADRVGHGLTLPERPELMDRFRERRIAVELCPTSNVEVVGYDPGGTYPLRRLMGARLPVAVCTDNPGISRTEPAAEYLRAAELVGGLTLWETLALIRNAFVHSFAPAPLRERLLQEADAEIYRLVSAWGEDGDRR
ncbi:MAG: hypothetical protein AB1758_15495 [Candidatus Eremiobacterota bacterium]